MDTDDFYLRVAHALSGCQLVEQELKLYITEALDLAKKCIGDRMPFKVSGENYADSSLERLIEAFRKLSDNDALVTELRQFKDERNFLSHKGITHCLDYEGELFHKTAVEFQDRLEAIQSEAQRLRNALHEEANKFRGHLMVRRSQECGLNSPQCAWSAQKTTRPA
ncbi:MAG: hypothetical protein Q8O38_09735 [Sulfurimicrobium sp.]|nr:hypothetical protein [Sulfurimicrobium sp.]